MAALKKGATTSLVDFNYYGNLHVGDIVKDLDSGIECEIDKYGRAMDKYGNDHSKRRLAIVKPYDAGAELMKKRKEAEKNAKEAEKDFQIDQLEKTEDAKIELAEEPSPAGGQQKDSATSEAGQSSTAEESASMEEEKAHLSLESLTDQQLADELRKRGYKVSASKVIIVRQEVTL